MKIIHTLVFAALCTASVVTRASESLSQSAAAAPAAGAPRGHIYGGVVSFDGIMTTDQGYWGYVDNQTGDVTPVWNGSEYGATMDYDLQSGAVCDGILYVPAIESTLAGDDIVWRRVDLTTGETLPPISFHGDWHAYAHSMAYDPASGLFHLLSLDYTDRSYGNYATVDPADNWRLDYKGPFEGMLSAGVIAYNPADACIWVFDDEGIAYRMADTAACELEEVGQIDPGYQLIYHKRTTAAVYSPLDRSFVFFYCDNAAQTSHLMYVDAETFDVNQGPALSPHTPYFGYLHCPDPYADSSAPAQPEAPRFDFAGPSLSGRASVTCPYETYGGFPLQGEVRVCVEIDGSEVYSALSSPGATSAFDLTLAEGTHTYSVTASQGDLLSPPRTGTVYAGNDIPVAPAGLTLTGNELSWQAVGGEGAHGGYVDTSALSYDVTIDGVKQNATPICATSFTIDPTRPLGRVEIAVTATACGHTSDASRISEIIGEGLTLPWSMRPTDEESALFTICNTAGDESQFEFGYDYDRGANIFELWMLDGDQADDWVFVPASRFDDPESLYRFSVGYRSSTWLEGGEDVDICIGRAPRPEAMERVLYSHRGVAVYDDTVITTPVGVAEAGDYVIGIHCLTPEGAGFGIHLFDFSLKKEEASGAVPAEAPAVEITAYPRGALRADIAVTMPTHDIRGVALDPAAAVSAEIAYAGEEGYSATATALPGQTATVATDVPRCGMAEFAVTTANSNGPGLTRSYKAYVGTDVPLAPTNIRGVASEDNLTISLTWDAPGTTGRHGGYVDPDNLSYAIYTVNGVTFNQVATLHADQLSYSYTPADPKQVNLIIGPAAVNEAGESRYSEFVSELIGRPYPVPVTEKFDANGYACDPIFYDMAGDRCNTVWAPLNTLSYFDTGCIQDFDRGGLAVYSLEGSHTGMLVLPKITTAHSPATTFTLRWLDWQHAPEMILTGRCYGDEDYETLATFTPSRPDEGEWVDSPVVLPARFNDCAWVEFHVLANLTGHPEEYGFIDMFRVNTDITRDLKISEVAAPSSITVGEKGRVKVTVTNAGREPVTDASLEIKVTDAQGGIYDQMTEYLGTVTTDDPCIYSFEICPEQPCLGATPLTVEATVISEGDQIPANDTMQREIAVTASQLPCIGTLRADWADEVHGSARLEWETPDLHYGGSDGFETLRPFQVTESLGMWVNLDIDRGYPFRIEGLEWENNNTPIAWQAIDAEQLRLMNDERLCPHTGKMYLMARTLSYDEEHGEEPTQSEDWLISPEVIGGTEIEFWYGTIDPALTEYIELWVSASGRGREDFRFIHTFSKEGAEAWENVRYTLPDDARYFALVYRSIDSFGAMLDDISFTPARLEQWEVHHYAIYRRVCGGAEERIGDTPDTGYTDSGLDGSSVNYRVTTAVKDGDDWIYGPYSNSATLGSSAVDDLRQLEGLSGGKGCLTATGHQGDVVALYDSAGKYLGSHHISSDLAVIPIDAGIYIAKCGNGYAKVIVR